MNKAEERAQVQKKIMSSSFASIVICIGLIIISKMAQSHGDLVTAFVLMITSNFVMLTYLFGIRHYFRVLRKQGDKDV